MGKWKYAAQYQQDPISEGGAIFQREWFSHRFRRDPATGLPLGVKLRMVIQSWDTAAKKKEANDFWACTTWGLVVGEDARILKRCSIAGSISSSRKSSQAPIEAELMYWLPPSRVKQSGKATTGGMRAHRSILR